MVYYVAQIWFAFVNIYEEFLHKLDDAEREDFFHNSKWSFDDKDHHTKFIILLYFSLTSLSTIGLGDYHPITNYERMLCTFLFLIGVILFSYTLGQLQYTLVEGGLLMKTDEHEEKMGEFFALIRYLNGNQPLNK